LPQKQERGEGDTVQPRGAGEDAHATTGLEPGAATKMPVTNHRVKSGFLPLPAAKFRQKRPKTDKNRYFTHKNCGNQALTLDFPRLKAAL
jgi:hypothetical protein